MGTSIPDAQNICINDGVCAHDPSPDTAAQPPTAFSNFRTTAASGIWTLCIGDSAELDTGALNQWRLTLTAADTYSANPAVSIPDDGYAGGFGGVGQTCSVINTASPAPASPTFAVLNHPGSTAPDNGTGTVGNSSNWSNSLIPFGDGFGPEAELMGTTQTTNQRICIDNGVCTHDPSPDTATQPPSAFSTFNGGNAIGDWTLCLGDSALGDVGTFNQWRLYLARPVISLAVTLESMNATATDNGVRVAWETASEVDNIGFHLYRSTDPAFAGERLTIELIPSAVPGGGQGATYEWVDAAAEVGVAYYYTLEDVDVNGVGTVYPPVPVTPTTPTAVTLTDMTTHTGFPVEWVAGVGVGLVVLGQVWHRLWRRG